MDFDGAGGEGRKESVIAVYVIGEPVDEEQESDGRCVRLNGYQSGTLVGVKRRAFTVQVLV